MDNTQSGHASKGAQETVAWFYGMRSFNGHPSFMWPTPRMVLDQFGTAHGWASKVLVEGTERNLTRMLVNRFSTLLSIADSLLRPALSDIEPPGALITKMHWRMHVTWINVGELHHTTAAGQSKSQQKLLSIGFRDFVLVLPALKQLISRLSDCESRI